MGSRAKHKKRNNQQPMPGRGIMHIGFGASADMGEMREIFSGLEKRVYQMGVMDGKDGRKHTNIRELFEDFDVGLPPEATSSITEAYCEIYLDGYHGRPPRTKIIVDDPSSTADDEKENRITSWNS